MASPSDRLDVKELLSLSYSLIKGLNKQAKIVFFLF